MHNKFLTCCVKKLKNIRSFSIYNTIGSINRARKTAALLAGAYIFANTITFAAPAVIEVKIVDDDREVSIVTSYVSVGDVLEENGIVLGKYDLVSPDVDQIVSAESVIVIDRVKKVTLNDSDITSEYYTTSDTVEEFFNENSITLSDLDIVDKNLSDKIDEDTSITITRVIKTTVCLDEIIPYKTVAVESPSLIEGNVSVTSEGKDGVMTTKYEVTLKNGVEQSRTEVFSEVTVQPVDKVISVGIRPRSGNAPENFKRVITCSATAYDLSFESCGKNPGDKGYGITATGTNAKYGTVAVDPSVIPLGSKLYIETCDGSFVYGYSTAEDTGGAIKGHKVDLFFPSYDDCINFGRRSVNVYIIE